MRNADFNVHPEIIVEFVEELTNRNLNSRLTFLLVIKTNAKPSPQLNRWAYLQTHPVQMDK